MSFSQHLVLWIHVAFAIFAIGPIAVAISSTPRYIRQNDVRVVRYLSRITFIFTIISLGVLIAGMALAQMLSEAAKPWVIVSATLFLVAIVLLILIIRDQRRAIKALETVPPAAARLAATGTADAAPESAGTGTDAGAGPGDSAHGDGSTGDGTAGEGAQGEGAPGGETSHAGTAGAKLSPAASAAVATVERGRIAMTGGVVNLIWLVILVLMIWNG